MLAYKKIMICDFQIMFCYAQIENSLKWQCENLSSCSSKHERYKHTGCVKETCILEWSEVFDYVKNKQTEKDLEIFFLNKSINTHSLYVNNI